jgi:hypothetical protein
MKKEEILSMFSDVNDRMLRYRGDPTSEKMLVLIMIDCRLITQFMETSNGMKFSLRNGNNLKNR